ncbi:nicotinate mononucleotide-dependent phosphoribosyltransferase CobT [Haladaptatus caseinilyticus]|uniref:nicotinate mononucleotide-dependent phosphoribosyltransferase CobT n=1 Tax=Haladaptatus caseinilyticus TaxID=2993314 RepID=UPI00224ACABE|nr:TIGR00303 family protein [Haladaptatus caseinilyticus]
MRFVLAAGATRTAEIDGISAAGAAPDLMAHTPSADVEIVEYGRPVRAPIVPVSPSGCPTPAVITRAVRERIDFDLTVIDAGLIRPTRTPTVSVGAQRGEDVRETEPVPCAQEVYEETRRFGAALPDDSVMIGETIPGGTTTALGVLTALDEDITVSSSLPDNPLRLKRTVVSEALSASDIDRGDAAGDPVFAVNSMGDPVLATVAGFTVGALESGIDVTLAGGTQMLAAAALVRHAGIDGPLGLATTSFVADDETVALDRACDRHDLDLEVTDPGFDEGDHVSMQRYIEGEGKEGVGMGGALALADRAAVDMDSIRDSVIEVYNRLNGDVNGP